MDRINPCRFCDVVNIGFRDNEPFPIYNTILYETSNFLVLPALGCLVPGYIMIISRKHVYSMAYLTEKEMCELGDLVQYLRGILLKKYGVVPILFEHGSALGFCDESACSVEHAHWHLVPIQLSEENKIIEDTGSIQIANLQQVRLYKGKPYMLYVNEKEQHYISNNTMLSSQYMRKWIAKEIGHFSEWDWRKYEFIDNITRTISLFRE